MPLRDHFRPPLDDDLPWESLHSRWAGNIAAALNLRWLTRDYRALEHTHFGPRIEIDVATVERGSRPASPTPNGGGIATIPLVWSPPAALAAIPAVFPDTFEVQVFSTRYGRRLVGAIEIISPGNKDRSEAREAFVAKCLSYLQAGVSVVIVDVITPRQANLHNAIAQRLQAPDSVLLPPESHLYAAAYRPVLRGESAEIDVWVVPCALGGVLPTMPLRLLQDHFVPVELEATYEETCREHNVT
jgi:hypothetical protein